MINTILLIGNGKLSKSLQPYLTNYTVHIFDVNNIEELLLYKGDLLIDCSSSFSFDCIYNYLKNNKIKAIICSTGHTQNQIIKLKELSNTMPILKSENFSIGINLINKFIYENKNILSSYDNYLFDYHHKNKKDSPSGTSKMLINSFYKEPTIYSIRSKDIIGIHKIQLFQDNEEIEITHRITSRDIFAKGITQAITFINKKEQGFFSMGDLINEI